MVLLEAVFVDAARPEESGIVFNVSHFTGRGLGQYQDSDPVSREPSLWSIRIASMP